MFFQRLYRSEPSAIVFLIAFFLTFVFSISATAGTCRVFFPATHTGWVIETPANKVYVIDPGVESEFYSTGKKGTGIGTYLKQRGIKQINGVVISHPHPDHFAAGVQLFQDFKVLELFDSGFNPRKNATGGYPAKFWNAFKASGATHRTGLHSGDLLKWDPELVIKICGPKRPFWTEAEAGNDPERFYNQNSLVLWMKHGDVSYLFTGDITAPAQGNLCKSAAAEVKSTTIFSVPHHGKYYLDKEFAALVGSDHPSLRLAIASENHIKKGPKADRVPAWSRAGITVIAGDGNNDVTVTSTGGKNFELKTTNPAQVRTYRVGK